MTASSLLVLQALTNLSLAPAGSGLPGGWRLERARGAEPPRFAVTRAHTLRIEAANGAGVATYRLRRPLRPRAGSLSWNWRTATPLRDAVLRQRSRDGAPVRVVVAFEDARMLLYTWGNREGRGERLSSSPGATRAAIVLERAEDADASWHLERRDPFADYRIVFNRAPRAIVAVGVAADTDRLKGHGVAEVSELTWEADVTP